MTKSVRVGTVDQNQGGLGGKGQSKDRPESEDAAMNLRSAVQSSKYLAVLMGYIFSLDVIGAASPVFAQTAQVAEQITVVAPYTTVKKKLVRRERTGGDVYVISASQPVSYAGLDLSKDSDVVLLEKNIRETAQSICKQLDRKYPEGLYLRVGVMEDCVKSATDEAIAIARRVVVGVRSDVKIGYPKEVALIYDETKGFIYRRSSGGQPLYVYDADKDGRSACNAGCSGERPPVYAPCSDKPMGMWTVIKREYGYCQWAYKGMPLYTFYKDLPDDSRANGLGKGWHVMPYTSKP